MNDSTIARKHPVRAPEREEWASGKYRRATERWIDDHSTDGPDHLNHLDFEEL
jgi:hypothetical protein